MKRVYKTTISNLPPQYFALDQAYNLKRETKEGGVKSSRTPVIAE